MEQPKSVKIVVQIETNERTEFITTDSIVAAVDFYNKTMNDIEGYGYHGFPLFKDECSEVDYHNNYTDTVAQKILNHFDDPAGTFGSDLLNKISKRYHRMKWDRNFYLNMLMIVVLSLLIAFFYVWGGLC